MKEKIIKFADLLFSFHILSEIGDFIIDCWKHNLVVCLPIKFYLQSFFFLLVNLHIFFI